MPLAVAFTVAQVVQRKLASTPTCRLRLRSPNGICRGSRTLYDGPRASLSWYVMLTESQTKAQRDVRPWASGTELSSNCRRGTPRSTNQHLDHGLLRIFFAFRFFDQVEAMKYSGFCAVRPGADLPAREGRQECQREP